MTDGLVLPDREDVEAAAVRLAGLVRRTPVLTCGALDELAGASLFFKCENFQTTGAFKFRGATHALALLADDVKAVATHSSGNHGAALAAAAQARGITAHVVMPANAAAVKRAAVVHYGGRVVECAPTLEARETALDQLVAETQA
ncbi:MAG: serine dehydratase, partial [Verrucomicrobiales bacterium]|nr:serine dehydratase [Verrucomicrobiales bacterium]